MKILPFVCRTQHTLPDGNQISIGPAMGAILGESLFNPQMIDSEGPGLADVCCECTVGQVRLEMWLGSCLPVLCLTIIVWKISLM